MPRVDAVVECPIRPSFRVRQVAGLFDLPPAERSVERFSVELPEPREAWRIGVIVGPSGSGKTTVARAAFGAAVCGPADWPADRAVIDGFADRPIHEITAALTAVGFGSPPAWIKPYAVLSNGEKFRCDLARALLSDQPLVVFDEFTSVVDRTAARIGSAAVAKAVRADRLARRFVAVSCHYDILEWLEPDWVLDLASRRLERGRLRRPPIELDVFRCRQRLWPLFARHHYLSGSLNPASRCYLAAWAGEPVAFAAAVLSFGHAGVSRISRVVVLPDYQGVGVGGRFTDAVAGLEKARGRRVTLTTGHPAMVRRLGRSPYWRSTGPAGLGGNHVRRARFRAKSPPRVVAGFEYVGPAMGGGSDG